MQFLLIACLTWIVLCINPVQKFVRESVIEARVNDLGETFWRRKQVSKPKSSMTVLRHMQNVESTSDSLQRDLEAAVKYIRQQNQSRTNYLTIQGTCHSYSDVATGPSALNMLNFRAFRINTTNRTVKLGPGVRFVDLLFSLKKNNLSLPAHGDYAGQTVIGALATGTHGSGLPSPHNFVNEMIVINGLGEVKTITSEKAEFSAWLNSVGALGVVLQLEMELVPDFAVERKLEFCTLSDAIEKQKNNRMSQITWPIPRTFRKFSNIQSSPAIFMGGRQVSKKVTRHSCCFGHLPLEDQIEGQVYSYNDDFVFDPANELAAGSSNLCNRTDEVHWVFGGIYTEKHRRLDLMPLPASFEITVPAEEVVRTCETFSSEVWPFEVFLSLRWVSQDTATAFLSSFYDGNRVSMEVWIYSSLIPNFDWMGRFESLVQKMRDSGIHVKHHPGKTKMDFENFLGSGAVADVEELDGQKVQKFLDAKYKEDPLNVFSNGYVKRLCAHANATFCF